MWGWDPRGAVLTWFLVVLAGEVGVWDVCNWAGCIWLLTPGSGREIRAGSWWQRLTLGFGNGVWRPSLCCWLRLRSLHGVGCCVCVCVCVTGLRLCGRNRDQGESYRGSSGRPQVGSSSHTGLLGLLQGPAWGLADRGPGAAPGALRLNRAALAHASGRHLRLLPRQRYLRAERAESSALERKRNVLCCLITRILKAEKQLHIDNLVFKVWRLKVWGTERGCRVMSKE